jgi:hypothetical protein
MHVTYYDFQAFFKFMRYLVNFDYETFYIKNIYEGRPFSVCVCVCVCPQYFFHQLHNNKNKTVICKRMTLHLHVSAFKGRLQWGG